MCVWSALWPTSPSWRRPQVSQGLTMTDTWLSWVQPEPLAPKTSLLLSQATYAAEAAPSPPLPTVPHPCSSTGPKSAGFWQVRPLAHVATLLSGPGHTHC